MAIFDLFFIPIQKTVELLNEIKILDISLAQFIVGFLIFGIVVSFLRGGSND